jgi:hypothetical protein
MAATFYSQILHTYAWDRIAHDLDGAIAEFRRIAASVDVNSGSRALDEEQVEYGHAVAMLDHEAFPDRRIMASFYLGSVMNNTPSGKVYAPWSDIPESVLIKDEAWWAALERAANRIGASIEGGEGDPTDIYICKYDDLDPPDRAIAEDAMADEGAR